MPVLHVDLPGATLTLAGSIEAVSAAWGATIELPAGLYIVGAILHPNA